MLKERYEIYILVRKFVLFLEDYSIKYIPINLVTKTILL